MYFLFCVRHVSQGSGYLLSTCYMDARCKPCAGPLGRGASPHGPGCPAALLTTHPRQSAFAGFAHMRRQLHMVGRLRLSVAADSVISHICRRPCAGIGFAKTGAGNCALVGGLPRVRAQLRGALRGMPLLVGPSRKGFLGRLTGAGCQGFLQGFPGAAHWCGLPGFLQGCTACYCLSCAPVHDPWDAWRVFTCSRSTSAKSDSRFRCAVKPC